ncbi:uncharacterized protein LOC129771909 isoform X2 [Toxorhynchites rutilus septentrionalis]|uniref:uncharacterized protein LOC129771909 isoform X2 n=1 Tax=Toxorhynchites rutilus septentrionalis TaxID=329112 RepID=UPI00247ACFF7|nr:uncharacterized protein LOC129771909 isoform X2 [Toxorhynchites rutilus septentrionalis]
MFAKFLIISCLLAVVCAKPHVLTPYVGPAFVTAHSSQVFARTYNELVPFAVPTAAAAAEYPVHFPAPVHIAYPAHPVPSIHFAQPAPTVLAYPIFKHISAVPVGHSVVAVPAAPAVIPAVAVKSAVAVTPVAKVVPAAPVAKLVAPVRAPTHFLTKIRYRSVVV